MCLPVYPGNGKQTVINTYTLIPMHTYSFQTQFGIQFECNKLCFENKNLMILVLDGFILYFFLFEYKIIIKIKTISNYKLCENKNFA